MRVSRKWLQTYFDEPLPSAETVADAYTFHAFEIEEVQDDMLGVKVLPNRAADCLSHRGLAAELSVILDIPLTKDPFRESLPEYPAPAPLDIHVEDPKKCLRYMGAVVRGVKVGPSPAWLKEALESVGQRSINNIVDATNYVMLDLGQPLHAFDAGKLMQKNSAYAIGVRVAKAGESITTLSDETLELAPSILLITDVNADRPIGIAGVKGGKEAEVTDATTDIIIESANFDGTTVRRGAQQLKLFTDASVRFQNRPSPELAAYGMRDVLVLITKIAGGEVEGVADVYPVSAQPASVVIPLSRVNGLLGSDFGRDEAASVFRRLGLPVEQKDDVFIVTPSFWRTDLLISEDLIEEVGRILGYDRVPSVELPSVEEKPDQARYRGIERIKDQLVEQGFIEVSTQSFARKGDILLANPLDKSKPALRTSLEENLKDAVARAKLNAPLVLPPNEKPRLFEIGTVFQKEGEHVELRMTEPAPGEGWEKFGTVDNVSKGNLENFGKDYMPKRYELGAYKPFSVYPFIVRDIALWVPASTDEGFTKSIICEHAGDLLVRLDQFDRFEKDGRVSYAFRLVFQSFERTLTDEEMNGIMERVYAAVKAAGCIVR